ncbi:ATP-dependent DNA helicase RecG [Tessaracoccus sp. MC1865]|uniref:ATP-dependent DNA helicase RecG n=1 Tax=Tessaracoccus sp. MC1865 TaxID=2760310 RepID=UPI0015FF4509|nr:ATP-dependent DNA helicase RecG [Tessaracoccus sp. MC1865]MBB1484356.1 ATP-dependent DNA helicase RecG [Tessaracoccus sp. MC1865]QTO38532.1 ATP-dependent DNA helicase RecG [Tessaracoccus sp. MC1865]
MRMWRTTLYRELNRRLGDVVGGPTAKEFAKLGIHTVDDLLRHVPRRYLAGSEMSDFSGLRVGEDAALVAQVKGAAKAESNGQFRVNAVITDGQTDVDVTFFAPRVKNNTSYGRASNMADWWVKELLSGDRRGIFIGRVGVFRDQLQLTHPEFVMLDGAAVRNPKTEKQQNRAAMSRAVQRSTLVGLYPAHGKLPTWVIAEAIQMALPAVAGDTLPPWVVQEAGVLPFQEALTAVHEPTDRKQAEVGKARLKFDEAFGIQLAMAHRRAQYAGESATPRPRRVGGLLDAFDERLPFTPTKGQLAIGEQVFGELARPAPMNRLLQGEVGSGKTLVALRAMLAVVDSGGQAVLLAPTEVLAKQHFHTIARFMGDLGQGRSLGAHPDATGVVLLTGSRSTQAKREALNAIVTGEAGIVVGTHALLSDPVEFFDLGLVVVDEQHRFGVEQRAALSAKAQHKPHTLVMTATPIPRSIAMTVFGDLETSELRERPAGRGEVQTVFVDTHRSPTWVTRAWERVREEVGQGRQAFVVCPAITAKEGEGLTAVEELAPLLAAGPLAGLRIGVVHGKQHVQDRDAAMEAFAAGDLDVLVATTVIEVGVDVPNATVMVIMDADRYGLSQLHQLRGRIGRGGHTGLCLLLAAIGDNVDAHTRLTALTTTTDGFELAELDLQLRREGDVLGAAQSGAGSLKLLRALDDADVITRARKLAEKVLADPRSGTDPLLADLMAKAEEVAAAEWMEKT